LKKIFDVVTLLKKRKSKKRFFQLFMRVLEFLRFCNCQTQEKTSHVSRSFNQGIICH